MNDKGSSKQARKAKAGRTVKAPSAGAAGARKTARKPAGGRSSRARSGDHGKEPSAATARSRGAAATAEQVLRGEAEHDAVHYVRSLRDAREATATQAARVVDEIVARSPQTVAPQVAELAKLIRADHKRVVQSAAHALPAIAKVAPARVAKQLPTLTAAFAEASDEAKDGLVRTFAALCNASVAYQRRLEDVLKQALAQANPKQLVQWAQLVLPALKGEPHARARAVVESRLEDIPRPAAQKIADFLGIKLRPAQR